MDIMAQGPGPPTLGSPRCSAPSGGGFMRMLGDYMVVKELYRGKRSWVVSAITPDGETVAVKGYIRREVSHLMFKVRRELIFLSELQHPHIIRGLDCWADDENVYIVQEMGALGDLTDVAARFRNDCIPETIVAQKIAKPMLQALSFLHERGIVHRDIKPENVVVTAHGVTKLCDFGLAIDSSTDPPYSRVGTLEFMAPEVAMIPRSGRPRPTPAQRSGMYGTPVDIWAFGCVVYELLYGASLFGARSRRSEEEIEAQILSSDPIAFPPTTAAAKLISAAGTALIAAALVRSPDARPKADDLLQMDWFLEPTVGLARTSSSGESAGLCRKSLSPSSSSNAPFRAHLERQAGRAGGHGGGQQYPQKRAARLGSTLGSATSPESPRAAYSTQGRRNSIDSVVARLHGALLARSAAARGGVAGAGISGGGPSGTMQIFGYPVAVPSVGGASSSSGGQRPSADLGRAGAALSEPLSERGETLNLPPAGSSGLRELLFSRLKLRPSQNSSRRSEDLSGVMRFSSQPGGDQHPSGAASGGGSSAWFATRGGGGGGGGGLTSVGSMPIIHGSAAAAGGSSSHNYSSVFRGASVAQVRALVSANSRNSSGRSSLGGDDLGQTARGHRPPGKSASHVSGFLRRISSNAVAPLLPAEETRCMSDGPHLQARPSTLTKQRHHQPSPQARPPPRSRFSAPLLMLRQRSSLRREQQETLRNASAHHAGGDPQPQQASPGSPRGQPGSPRLHVRPPTPLRRSSSLLQRVGSFVARVFSAKAPS